VLDAAHVPAAGGRCSTGSGSARRTSRPGTTISRRIFVPFHGDGIISQFEGYERLQEFDWEGYKARYDDIHRLDRLLEAEGKNPNDYKASKQADVLMLFYLFSTAELFEVFERLGYGFDPAWIPKAIDYYLARTSHGSTLSHLVHSWVLARSDRPMAWNLLQNALDADVGDIQGGTTREGIHLGAMAGTVDLFQRCFTGLEVRAGILHVNPLLPEGVDTLSVRIRCRDHSLTLATTRESMTITSEPGVAPALTIGYRGHFRDLGTGGTVRIRLVAPSPRDP
jgi:trehalose/maltose hydrolase-like predicted phosphorylase